MLELSEKDFKATVMKMFQWAMTNTLETNGKLESLSKEIESLSKEIKDIKTNQI